jgi:hypothetical protein
VPIYHCQEPDGDHAHQYQTVPGRLRSALAGGRWRPQPSGSRPTITCANIDLGPRPMAVTEGYRSITQRHHRSRRRTAARQAGSGAAAGCRTICAGTG